MLFVLKKKITHNENYFLKLVNLFFSIVLLIYLFVIETNLKCFCLSKLYTLGFGCMPFDGFLDDWAFTDSSDVFLSIDQQSGGTYAIAGLLL